MDRSNAGKAGSVTLRRGTLPITSTCGSVVGFIAVAPNVGLARDLIGADRRAVEGLRGHLIIGALDPRRDDCVVLADQLRGDGAEVQLEVIEGLRHDYPFDFEDRLPQLLAWALEGGG